MKIPQINKQIFQKFNAKLAYLFGSQAKGNAAPESDFDIAVLFENPSDELALRETSFLSLDLNKFLPRKLDIVSLNAASLLLKYEVVAHGQPLYCRDEKERINFEVSVIKGYIDEGPVRNLYNQALYKRILQGV
ncbi:MAG: nucleotidyltransferase domain-containing protein [Candidatus Omnitrophica bacterium]|nr:nucleotidyltransferase domain-containing protein [Candidatus Omnitrophota bacterium]